MAPNVKSTATQAAPSARALPLTLTLRASPTPDVARRKHGGATKKDKTAINRIGRKLRFVHWEAAAQLSGPCGVGRCNARRGRSHSRAAPEWPGNGGNLCKCVHWRVIFSTLHVIRRTRTRRRCQ